MRNECYVLDIYCDYQDECLVFGYGASEQYTGRNQTEARKSARDAGWKIGKRDVCPTCREAGRD